MEENNKENKLVSLWRKSQLWVGGSVLFVGLVLILAGFFVPPVGEIHPTVLVAFGEALSFVGSVIGIDYRYHNKYKQ